MDKALDQATYLKTKDFLSQTKAFGDQLKSEKEPKKVLSQINSIFGQIIGSSEAKDGYLDHLLLAEKTELIKIFQTYDVKFITDVLGEVNKESNGKIIPTFDSQKELFLFYDAIIEGAITKANPDEFLEILSKVRGYKENFTDLDDKANIYHKNRLLIQYWNANKTKTTEDKLENVTKYILDNDLSDGDAKWILQQTAITGNPVLNKKEQNILKDFFKNRLKKYLEKIDWYENVDKPKPLVDLSKIKTSNVVFAGITNLATAQKYVLDNNIKGKVYKYDKDDKNHRFYDNLLYYVNTQGSKIETLKQDIAEFRKRIGLLNSEISNNEQAVINLTTELKARNDGIRGVEDIKSAENDLNDAQYKLSTNKQNKIQYEANIKNYEQNIKNYESNIDDIKKLLPSNEYIKNIQTEFTKKNEQYSKQQFEGNKNSKFEAFYNEFDGKLKNLRNENLILKNKFCKFHIAKEKHDFIVGARYSGKKDAFKDYNADPEDYLFELSNRVANISASGPNDVTKEVVENAKTENIEKALKVPNENVIHGIARDIALAENYEYLAIAGAAKKDEHFTSVANSKNNIHGYNQPTKVIGLVLALGVKLGKIFVESGNDGLGGGFKFVEYEKKNDGNYADFYISENYISDEKLFEQMAENSGLAQHFTKCTKSKWRNFAEVVLSLKNQPGGLGQIKIKDDKQAHEQLFFREYREALVSNNRNVEIKNTLDPKGLKDILNAIDNKKFSIDQLDLRFEAFEAGNNPNAVLYHLEKFIEQKKDDARDKREYFDCGVRDLVLRFDSYDPKHNYKEEILEIASACDQLGIKKLVVECHDFAKHDVQEELFKYLKEKAVLGLNIEIEVSANYIPNQEVKNLSIKTSREIRQKELLKRMEKNPHDQNNTPIVEYVHIDKSKKINRDPRGAKRLEDMIFGKLNVDVNQDQAIDINAQVHEKHDVDKVMVQEQGLNLNEYQNQNQDNLNGIKDEDLIKRSNILEKINDGKLRINNGFKNKYHEKTPELEYIWDRVTNSSKNVNDNKKIKPKIDAMSPDAALLLLTFYDDGLISGGLNLNYLPLGFFTFQFGDLTVLDYNVNIAIQKDSHYRVKLRSNTKYPYEADESLSNFDIKSVQNCNDLKKFGVEGDLIKKITDLFTDKANSYAKPILRAIHYGNKDAVKIAINYVEVLQKELGKNWAQFEKFFLEPITRSDDFGANFFLEKESAILLEKFKNFIIKTDKKDNTKKLEFFLHLIDRTCDKNPNDPNDKVKNINPLYLFEPFQEFLQDMEKLGVNVEKCIGNTEKSGGFAIKNYENLQVTCYRIANIINSLKNQEIARYKDNGLEWGDKQKKEWCKRAERIFTEMLQGKISLAERDAYHAVCIDKLRDIDSEMTTNLGKIGLYQTDEKIVDQNFWNMTYNIPLEKLRDFCANNGNSFDDMSHLLLRHINKPVDTKSDEYKQNLLLQLKTETAKGFLNEARGLDNDEMKKAIVNLFVILPPVNYQAGSIAKIVENVGGNMTKFTELAKTVSGNGAEFNDLLALSALCKQLGGVSDKLIECFKTIKDKKHPWMYYKNAIANLLIDNEGPKVNFIELFDHLNDPDKGIFAQISKAVKGKKDVGPVDLPRIFVAASVGNDTKNATEIVELLRKKVGNGMFGLGGENKNVNGILDDYAQAHIPEKDDRKKIAKLEDIQIKKQVIDFGNLLIWSNLQRHFLANISNGDIKKMINSSDSSSELLKRLPKKYLVESYLDSYSDLDDKSIRELDIYSDLDDKSIRELLLRASFLEYFVPKDLQDKNRLDEPKFNREYNDIYVQIKNFLDEHKIFNLNFFADSNNNYSRFLSVLKDLNEKFPGEIGSFLSEFSSKKFKDLEYFKNINDRVSDFIDTLDKFVAECHNNFESDVLYDAINDYPKKDYKTILDDVDKYKGTLACDHLKLGTKRLLAKIARDGGDNEYVILNDIIDSINEIYKTCEENRDKNIHKIEIDQYLLNDIVEYYSNSVKGNDIKTLSTLIPQIKDVFAKLRGSDKKKFSREDAKKIVQKIKDVVKLGMNKEVKTLLPNVMEMISVNIEEMSDVTDFAKYFLMYKKDDNKKLMKTAGINIDETNAKSIEIAGRIISICKQRPDLKRLYSNPSVPLDEIDKSIENITEKTSILGELNLVLESIKSTQVGGKEIDKAPLENLKQGTYKYKYTKNTIEAQQKIEDEKSESEFRKYKVVEIKRGIDEVNKEIEQCLSLLVEKRNKDPKNDRDENFYKQYDDSELFLAKHAKFIIAGKRKEESVINNIDYYFKIINSYAIRNSKLTQADLQKNVNELSKKIRDRGTDPGVKLHCQLELLGLLREAYYRTDGKYAYSTQLLPILYLMTSGDHRMMSEVSTGQGKSLIVALYSSLYALSGSAVHVTSSTDTLARRDFDANKRFYESVGLKNYFINSSGIKDHQGNKHDYSGGGIYHSSQSDVYFWMADKRNNGQYDSVDGVSKILIGDEADAITLDNKTSWRLALNSGGMDGFSSIYRLINEYYEANPVKKDEKGEKKDSKSIGEGLAGGFLTVLKSKNEDLYNLLLKYAGNDENFLKDEVKSLFASAMYVETLKEDKDFAVEKIQVMEKRGDKLVPVNYNVARIIKSSGETDKTSQWGDGVQQLLHEKLQRVDKKGYFKMDPKALSLTAGTTKQLIPEFDYFFGLTGTVGNDQDMQLLSEQYLIESALKIPTHQILKGKSLDPVIVGLTEEEKKLPKEGQEKSAADKHANQIIKIAQGGLPNDGAITKENKDIPRKKGQPMLIICENIAKAKELYEKMKSEFPDGIQIITGEESHEENEIKLEKAGKQNMITISTPFSGRGTDIDVKGTKGLYVLVTAVFPDRTYQQIIGRKGRNGDPGKNMTILNELDYSKYLREEDKDKSVKEKILTIQKGIFGDHKNYILKQVAESQLAELLFREFCLYQDAIRKNHQDNPDPKAVSEKDKGAIASELQQTMQRDFANFLEGSYSLHKDNFKTKPGESFDSNEFKTKVTDEVMKDWAVFVNNNILSKVKITHLASDLEAEIKRKSEDEVKKIRKNVNELFEEERAKLEQPAPKVSIQKERKIVTFDQKVQDRLGYSNLKKIRHEELLQHSFIDRSTDKYETYYNPILAPDYKFNKMEQQMIGVANVINAGYEVKHVVAPDKKFLDTDEYYISKELIHTDQIGFEIDNSDNDGAQKIKELLEKIGDKGFEVKLEGDYKVDGKKLLLCTYKNASDAWKTQDKIESAIIKSTFKQLSDDIEKKSALDDKFTELSTKLGINDLPIEDLKKWVQDNKVRHEMTKEEEEISVVVPKLGYIGKDREKSIRSHEKLTQKNKFIITQNKNGEILALFYDHGVSVSEKDIDLCKKEIEKVGDLKNAKIIIPVAGKVGLVEGNGGLNFDKWSEFINSEEVLKIQNDSLGKNERLTDEQVRLLFIEAVSRNEKDKNDMYKLSGKVSIEKLSKYRAEVAMNNNRDINHALVHLFYNGNKLFTREVIDKKEFDDKTKKEFIDKFNGAAVDGCIQDFVNKAATLILNIKNEIYNCFSIPDNQAATDLKEIIKKFDPKAVVKDGRFHFMLDGPMARKNFLEELKNPSTDKLPLDKKKEKLKKDYTELTLGYRKDNNSKKKEVLDKIDGVTKVHVDEDSPLEYINKLVVLPDNAQKFIKDLGDIKLTKTEDEELLKEIDEQTKKMAGLKIDETLSDDVKKRLEYELGCKKRYLEDKKLGIEQNKECNAKIQEITNRHDEISGSIVEKFLASEKDITSELKNNLQEFEKDLNPFNGKYKNLIKEQRDKFIDFSKVYVKKIEKLIEKYVELKDVYKIIKAESIASEVNADNVEEMLERIKNWREEVGKISDKGFKAEIELKRGKLDIIFKNADSFQKAEQKFFVEKEKIEVKDAKDLETCQEKIKFFYDFHKSLKEIGLTDVQNGYFDELCKKELKLWDEKQKEFPAADLIFTPSDPKKQGEFKPLKSMQFEDLAPPPEMTYDVAVRYNNADESGKKHDIMRAKIKKEDQYQDDTKDKAKTGDLSEMIKKVMTDAKEKIIKHYKRKTPYKLDDKINVLLEALADYSKEKQDDIDKGGEDVGFKKWKNEEDFQNLVERKYYQNNIMQIINWGELGTISKYLQEASNESFGTIKDKIYTIKVKDKTSGKIHEEEISGDVMARSWRMAIAKEKADAKKGNDLGKT